MPIKYTPEYNAEIKRKVYNFNRTIKRAEQAGVFKNRLPNPIKVTDIKESYKNKADLDRILKHLDKFTREATEDRITIGEDFKTTRWNYDFLKLNQEIAQNYFKSEYLRLENRLGRYPGQRDYLDTLSAKIETLGKDITAMSDKEYQASLNSVYEFLTVSSRQRDQYRGYLRVVEEVMDVLNIDETVKNKFFRKFEKLTPTQFLYMYNNNDVIARVYELYFTRNVNGEVQLNTDVDSANEIIESLLEQTDLMIEDAKLNAV